MPRITIFGSLNIDLVSYVPHHPLPGETLTSNSFAVSPGGKGANQAVACAKLSRPRSAVAAGNGGATAEVAMVGCVGSDSYGTLLRDNLAAHGVDVSGVVQRDGLKTGVAVIIVDEPTGQNRIVLSPEANHALRPADLAPGGAVASALGIRAAGGNAAAPPAPNRPDLLILQLEIPLDTVLEALRAAREAGIPVLLNPAPAVPGFPAEALRGLAHLVLNETEAAILSGSAESDLETEEGLERVARAFVTKGVRNVVITLGGRGVYFMSAAAAAAPGAAEKKGLLPALKAKVVDTTAAGDTFVGQYALEAVTAAEFDIVKAVEKANRAAARTVERQGAQVSIPWKDELETAI